jgi:lysophospholipase L1-like esterase
MRWPVVTLALLTVLAGAGCAGEGREQAQDRPDLKGQEYAAMGDSFTAGSGLPDADPITVCQRSANGYPGLVARRLDLELRDVSCGGSTTGNLSQPQGRGAGSNPPQAEAVRRSTDVVTIGWGYNDAALYSTLLWGCTAVGPSDPERAPCHDQTGASGEQLESAPAAIGASIEAVVDQVHDLAPDARILVVGYPQLVPESGTCPELPLAAGDYPWVRGILEQLHEEMAAAAERADATYVDVWEASAGHDVCAGGDAWVSGAAQTPEQAAPFHPLRTGQAAVAELVVDALED